MSGPPPTVRPPSTIERIKSPVFAMKWLALPDGRSILACGGGGGSARTGVSNVILVSTVSSEPYNPLNSNIQYPTTPVRRIDTGDRICVGIDLLWTESILKLVAAVGDEIHLHELDLSITSSTTTATTTTATTSTTTTTEEDKKEQMVGSVVVGHDGVNAVAFDAAGGIAVGCENGMVVLYDAKLVKVAESNGHFTSPFKKGVCQMVFSPSGQLYASASRDGTARLWDRTGREVAKLLCSAVPMGTAEFKKKPPTKKTTVMVRGCQFGPTERTVYTCCSGKRGPSYVSIWGGAFNDDKPQNQKVVYGELQRICVSPVPVSSLSCNLVKTALVIGNVEGSISVFATTTSNGLILQKMWRTVHDLPVTCTVASPFVTEQRFAVVSASADNRLAFLSLQSLPRKWSFYILWMLWLLMGAVLGVTWYDACRDEFSLQNLAELKACMKHSIVATEDMPGVAFVPH